jgi:hypothetical protein
MARLNADDAPLRIVDRCGLHGPVSRRGSQEKALRAWVGQWVDQGFRAKDHTTRFHRFSSRLRCVIQERSGTEMQTERTRLWTILR